MFKKIILALLSAALLAVNFSGTAQAAEDQPGGIRLRGELISVDPAAGSFQVKTQEGSLVSFFASDETAFRGQAHSLAELEAGWKVGVAARQDEQGKYWAVLVISGNPADTVRARGVIRDVNPSAGKFTLEKASGEKLTFFVDEGTRYGGQLQSLDQLQEGWLAAVVGTQANPGKLLAFGLVAREAPELLQLKGEISGLDPAGGSFTILTPDGRQLSIQTNAKTRYAGQLTSLDDLQVGWKAGVAARELENGDLLAVVVISGTRPELIRAQGTIKTVNPGAGKFQLEQEDGTVLTVYVDGRTSFRGPVSSFAGLEKGQRAGFGGYLDQEGRIVARIVVAGRLPADRSGREAPQGIRPEEDNSQPSPDQFREEGFP